MHGPSRQAEATRTAASSWLVAVAAGVAAAAALVFLLHPSMGGAARAQGPLVSTAATSLGRVLVDSKGHTLYLFGRDRNGKSSCAGSCAKLWPPLIASSRPRASVGVKASKLGTTRRADGRLQVTYNRHPLYTFVK